LDRIREEKRGQRKKKRRGEKAGMKNVSFEQDILIGKTRKRSLSHF
jgi:hypothetical protein